ncbi:MAG: DsbA family protein, partial [Rhodospirillales bacterium]|nr:DsbA family protein [Rhodospirillales bacterium]
MLRTSAGGLALAAALVLTAPAAPAAEIFDKAQKAAIEKLVHDYLMAHPEVILDSVKRLEARER